MKAELKIGPHSEIEGANAVEVWHNGRLVCTVVGADGPGVRVVSQHPITIVPGGATIGCPGINYVNVVVDPNLSVNQ